jgi:hypothetical protein
MNAHRDVYMSQDAPLLRIAGIIAHPVMSVNCAVSAEGNGIWASGGWKSRRWTLSSYSGGFPGLSGQDG